MLSPAQAFIDDVSQLAPNVLVLTSIEIYLLINTASRPSSTRNVPPQHHDWWAGAVRRELAAAGLSQEIIDQIMQDTDSWPMGMDEVQWHREQLVKEHSLNDGYRLNNVAWNWILLRITAHDLGTSKGQYLTSHRRAI